MHGVTSVSKKKYSITERQTTHLSLLFITIAVTAAFPITTARVWPETQANRDGHHLRWDTCVRIIISLAPLWGLYLTPLPWQTQPISCWIVECCPGQKSQFNFDGRHLSHGSPELRPAAANVTLYPAMQYPISVAQEQRSGESLVWDRTPRLFRGSFEPITEWARLTPTHRSPSVEM